MAIHPCSSSRSGWQPTRTGWIRSCWNMVDHCNIKPAGKLVNAVYVLIALLAHKITSSLFNDCICYVGAILLQGFDVNEAIDFQEAVLQFSPDLCDTYRGTSPRNQIPGTQVYSLACISIMVGWLTGLGMNVLIAMCCFEPSKWISNRSFRINISYSVGLTCAVFAYKVMLSHD